MIFLSSIAATLVFFDHSGNIIHINISTSFRFHGASTSASTLPSICNSDHDIVLYVTTFASHRPKPERRKIYLWKSADISGIKQAISNFDETFKKFAINDIDSMCNSNLHHTGHYGEKSSNKDYHGQIYSPMDEQENQENHQKKADSPQHRSLKFDT